MRDRFVHRYPMRWHWLIFVLAAGWLAGCAAPNRNAATQPAADQARSARPRPSMDMADDARRRVVWVADAVLRDFQKPLGFDLGDALLMTGMCDAAELTGDARYQEFAQRWADHWAGQDLTAELARGGYQPGFAGQWSPGLPLLRLYAVTGDDRYRAMIEQIVTYMLTQAPRMQNGGLCHFQGRQVLLVDTLWMAVPLLTQAGRVMDRPDLQQEAARQVLLHADHLFDRERGLWHHFYEEPSGRRSSVLWCRGNGYAAAATLEALRSEPPGPQRDRLIDLLRTHLHGLIRYQNSLSGLWSTVLDVPQTYFETSGSALILYAMLEAQRSGLLTDLPAEVLEQSWFSLRVQIDVHHRITGTSGSTVPAGFEHYAGRPVGIYPWGTGAWLMAACARARVGG